MRSKLFSVAVLFLTGSLFALDWSNHQPIGAVESVEKTDRALQLRCSDGSELTLSVLAPDLVRVQARFPGQPVQDSHSWAIDRTDWAPVQWTFSESAEAYALATAELEVVIRRNPVLVEFRDPVTQRVLNSDERPMARDPKSGRLAVAKKLGFDEHFYGLGAKASKLDKRRGRYTMWTSDTPGYGEGKDPIYQSIPFYMGWENGEAYGIFHDNSWRTTFDMGHSCQEYAGFASEGGHVDYYFFRGPSMKKILGRYTELTGRMPMPPLWALGNQQCRYSYYPDTMVDRVVKEYRDRDLPLDVMYLDIHYMDAYRVFTWDPVRFPDPAALNARLEKQGVKVVTIIDPGVKYQPVAAGSKEPRYSVFDEGTEKDYFLRRKDGSVYIGEVWPGKSVFVDYTKADARAWWGDQHRKLFDVGVDGIWNDMNEPADFIDQTGATQMDVVFDDNGRKSPYGMHRNMFALNMNRSTYEGLTKLYPDRRPFIITRAGYAGVQRYATMWTGDNTATFESLALNIPMFANLGLSGEAFVGSDVPGFIGRGDGELLARSYQVAAFVPLCRNHSAVDSYDHEPWRFGAYYEGIVRKFLKLRYSLMPYLYTTLEESHSKGVPFFRPLLLNYQDDANTLDINDQFMVGDALMAAPVVRAAQRQREVYLPKGTWYDFWTGKVFAGGDMISVEVPLDTMPLFVRGGSILPSTDATSHTGEKPWSPLRLAIYPDANGVAAGSLYEDDGASPAYKTGAFRRTTVGFRKTGAEAVITVEAAVGPHKTPARLLEFIVPAVTGTTVLLDGKPLPSLAVGQVTTVGCRHEAGLLHVSIPDDGKSHSIQLR